MPEICRFDASGCGFPSPRVPLLPAPGLQELAGNACDRVPAQLLDGPGVRRFARGRYALHAAFQAAGLGPGTVLLLKMGGNRGLLWFFLIFPLNSHHF